MMSQSTSINAASIKALCHIATLNLQYFNLVPGVKPAIDTLSVCMDIETGKRGRGIKDHSEDQTLIAQKPLMSKLRCTKVTKV